MKSNTDTSSSSSNPSAPSSSSKNGDDDEYDAQIKAQNQVALILICELQQSKSSPSSGDKGTIPMTTEETNAVPVSPPLIVATTHLKVVALSAYNIYSSIHPFDASFVSATAHNILGVKKRERGTIPRGRSQSTFECCGASEQSSPSYESAASHLDHGNTTV